MGSNKKNILSTGQHIHGKIVYRRFAFFVVSVLTLSLCLTLTFLPIGATPKAHAASWNEIWNDEFNGAANTAVDSQWQFDLGTGWGNNQVETDTNSTSNIYQDGNGRLAIKAINSNGSWTSGRIETTNASFAAPADGQLEVTASIQLPNVTGRPSGCLALPYAMAESGPASARSTRWRASMALMWSMAHCTVA